MMRIDGLSSSYPLDRTSRTGGAVQPYRPLEPVEEVSAVAPSTDTSQRDAASASQADLTGYVARSERTAEQFPARFSDLSSADYERPLNSRAAQALASYGSTANLKLDVDANEVLGLDLYA